MDIKIEVSARHVHLSEKDMVLLFGNEKLFKTKDLSQPGQFVYNKRVTVVGEKGKIENIAILGPCRKNTQVEISLTDCIKLGIKPVIRESGDLKETSSCKIIGDFGEINLENGVIVAKRHIHMNNEDAKKLNVKNGEIKKVKVKSKYRSLIFDDVVIRVDDNFSLAMHVDTDEANAFGYTSYEKGEILK